MRKIWKYSLYEVNVLNTTSPDGVFATLLLPRETEILTVQWQNNSPVIWALVDPWEDEKELHHFVAYATGHNLPDNLGRYIGTVQESVFVWHIFETEE
jgi:hypothetical protein